MITFKGIISGKAEKMFWKRQSNLLSLLIGIATFTTLPIILLFWNITNQISIPIVFFVFMIALAFLVRLPKREKARKEQLPLKIHIEDGVIMCRTQKGVESKSINDVKTVKDYGEFYVIDFPVGNVSTHFICQKNLIVEGSLKEFEELFGNKLVRIKK